MRRLSRGVLLTEADRGALAHLTRTARAFEPRRYLAHEEDPVPRVLVVLEGWACRSKLLPGGDRIITDLILPGDICHALTSLLHRADHSVMTLSRCVVAEADPAEILEILERRSGAAHALRWSSLQADSILRQRLLNNGRSLSSVRIAHLICEVHARLRAAGQATGDGLAWPLTQQELGDATAMTGVHVNRSLRDLRKASLIGAVRPRMQVPCIDRLAAYGGFDAGYLHLRDDRAAGSRPRPSRSRVEG